MSVVCVDSVPVVCSVTVLQTHVLQRDSFALFQAHHRRHADNMFSLKDAARQAFHDRIRVAKERLDDNVSFLQRRIV